jgi:very-short-patch-repair endonuclease
MKKKTTEQYIAEVIDIHGDKYDYSNTVYNGKENNVIIICKKHGEFTQCANAHLRGSGCKKCATEKTRLLQKSDTNTFTEKAKKIYGDKYDYSKSVYVNSKTKVIIICKIHGEFLQTPTDHYHGGCKKCADILRGENRKFSKEEIIQKSREVHGEIYDYSIIEYINGVIENIKCKEHGLFSQLRDIHINRNGGCKKCADILRGENRKYTKEEIIQRAKEVHDDAYDYSKVIYTGIYDKIIIICKEHGEFEQTPSNHIRGAGCQKCYDERRGTALCFTKEEILQKAKEVHGDTYDYSKALYNGIDNKMTIICNTHGEFLQTPYCHINKEHGCKMCSAILRGKNRTWTTEQFIEKANIVHKNIYNYTKTEYTKQNEKVIIICKTHGEFSQAPSNHIQGQGCPFCINKTETKLYEKIQHLYSTIITQFKQEWCKKIKHLPFDFVIPEHKIIIELDGPQHFQQISNWSSPEEQFENDKYKETCANDNGYSVIRLLQEDVFYDTYDWVKELCETIEEIKNGDEVVNVYLCKNGEYDAF